MLAKFFGVWFVLAIVSVVPAIAADAPPIFVGGQFIREHAIDDGRGHLLVPVRGVFEAFHATVTYTKPRFVVVRKDGAVIAGLIVDRHHAVVGHRARSLPVAPARHKGRVYVPLRFIAEIAGASVTYSTRPRLVNIRLPTNELALAVPLRDMPEVPPEPVVPPWAYGLVGALVLGFVIELARRLAVATPRKGSKRLPSAGFTPLAALQVPYAGPPGDQHGVGQIRK